MSTTRKKSLARWFLRDIARSRASKRPAWSSITPAPSATKPSRKSFNRLHDYKKLQAQGKKFGVLGCVAQQEGEKIFERAPYVSMVCGSASYRNLPEMLIQIEAGNARVTGLDDRQTDDCFETEFTAAHQSASRIHHHHRGLRQVLRLLRGAFYARQRAQPDFGVGPGRDPPDGRSRLYRNSIARAERELLQGSVSEKKTLPSCWRPWAKSRGSGACGSPLRIRGISAETLSTPSTRPDALRSCSSAGAERIDARADAMQRLYTREQYLERIAWIKAAKPRHQHYQRHHCRLSGETEADSKRPCPCWTKSDTTASSASSIRRVRIRRR